MTNAFNQFKSGAESTLKQRALSIAQLMTEMSGMSNTPIYQDMLDLAKKYRKEQEKSGVYGFIGGMAVDPVNWATVPLAAGRGLTGMAQLGAVSGAASGGLQPLERGGNRLKNTYIGGAIGAGTNAALYGAGKAVTSKPFRELLADEFGGVGGDLPMDYASRMARAKEMGYNTRMYHGTNKQFDNFSLDSVGTSVDAGGLGRGVYFTSSPERAGRYAAINRQKPWEMTPEEGEKIIPVLHNMKNPKIIDDPIKTNSIIGKLRYDKEKSQEFTDKLKNEGHDGVIAKHADGSYEYVVLNPKNIRSVFAKFDPKKANSSDLLAIRTPLTAGLGGALAYDAHNKGDK